MKNIIYFFTFCVLCTSCKPSPEYTKNEDGTLTWISIDQAADLKNHDEKLYFIDVYTTWCRYCKVMDKETFTDPEVIKLLDEKFHSVKFDAEQMNMVTWEGQEYVYKPGGRKGIHGLAPKLLNNRLSYPSFAILDKDRNPIKTIVGYKNPEKLITELNSF